ncbi:MAG: prepilin-type N-terminal cleavage/methylation domain-containing protein [Chthoniobacter sp.]|nr:prepilin-type N-terminal cleavage/methylation domain-containing protein [Chthoniobacter sp.]
MLPRKISSPYARETEENALRPRLTAWFWARDPARSKCGFSLIETLVAVAIVSIGFLGAFATAVQGGKLAAAAEDEGLVPSALEQRIDQLRLLSWPELTDGTGITTKVWTARPAPTATLDITQETLTLSPWDVSGAKTLTATWNENASPTVSFDGNVQPLSDADAVKVVATLTWTGRRTLRTQTRSLVTVISKGGISKSDLP